MTAFDADLTIVGAGPVGLMCAYLAHRCGLRATVIDRSTGPLAVGRADALNARTLQLLELAGLFAELHPLGKPCNTSSVWADGRFVSRRSAWWEALEGCFHKHFLMLGQAHLERLLDRRCREAGVEVRRACEVADVQLEADGCLTTLADGTRLRSAYVVGADGGRSLVRKRFGIPFAVVRPEITWAVVDGVIETDFPKVPEIIVFQAETADVAWIPREGELDRFYVRMDTTDFTFEEVLAKINHAMRPHTVAFREVEWCSQFSVKEAVADRFSVGGRVFLAGDACHVHSVNGGQGLNTGLADAFNLVWKFAMVQRGHAPATLLDTYEAERRPVALSVVESSGALVRATRTSATGTHGEDYVDLVAQRAGNVTGMGIRYAGEGLAGTRLFDMPVWRDGVGERLYSLLGCSRFTLLVFGPPVPGLSPPPWVQVITLPADARPGCWWTSDPHHAGQAVLVRPDGYIAWARPLTGDVCAWLPEAFQARGTSVLLGPRSGRPAGESPLRRFF
jgi:2-polyprenyl-6-methoxyphenol hydroxylase-like FAD-dependent oxidoreductase